MLKCQSNVIKIVLLFYIIDNLHKIYLLIGLFSFFSCPYVFFFRGGRGFFMLLLGGVTKFWVKGG
jgi:hypothetical protein